MIYNRYMYTLIEIFAYYTYQNGLNLTPYTFF